MNKYKELGEYSDIVSFAHSANSPVSKLVPGEEAVQAVRKVLGFSQVSEKAMQVRVEREWEEGELACEEISWTVGYGPRTKAWLYKPKSAKKPLPGILALHCHSGYKFYGKEKIADGPEPSGCNMDKLKKRYYGGRSYVNKLAGMGFVVLVHDVFTWGSRKFPLDIIDSNAERAAEKVDSELLNWMEAELGTTQEAALYNIAASKHEQHIEKYCNLLGTTFAGVVNYEDRVALDYLASRDEVDADALGCLGLSGGGCRSGLLQAASEKIKAAVVVGMMSTYEGLLDQHVTSHTFMLFPAGWSRYGDWPDLVAARAPSPLLVQYDIDDTLFAEAGMRQADAKLKGHYKAIGASKSYRGEFYPGSHKFDVEMQESAFSWLGVTLKEGIS
jgi:dienelactone hydrolase